MKRIMPFEARNHVQLTPQQKISLIKLKIKNKQNNGNTYEIDNKVAKVFSK